jgi:hypothetical protein
MKSLKTKILLINITLLLVVGVIICISIFQNVNGSTHIVIRPSKYYEALSIEDIIDLTDGDVTIRRYNRGYGYRGGNISEISGRFTTGTILTPRDAVRALTSVRDIMNIGSFSYICTEGRKGEYHLQQIYKGVEIINGRFEILATDEGIPLFIGGWHVDVGKLNPNPSISSCIARESIHFEEGTWISETKLIIYQTYEGEIHLCWYFQMNSIYIDQRQGILVDAHTGDFIGGGIGAALIN